MLAKRTYKNQVTIPQGVIKDFPGVEYFDVLKRGREIVLIPVDVQSSQGLEEIRDKMQALQISEEDVKEAVKWARKKR